MGSVRRRGGRVRVVLDAAEAALVLSLAAQVLELLADGDMEPGEPDSPVADPGSPESLEQLLDASAGPVETPRDPALLRLLPDGYRNDDDAAGEFRRLTESGLRATKRAALQRLVDDLSGAPVQKDGDLRLDLDDAASEAWLPALTDLRLTLGTRIGVTEELADAPADAPEGSIREAEIEVYHWITWLQDAVLQALMGE